MTQPLTDAPPRRPKPLPPLLTSVPSSALADPAPDRPAALTRTRGGTYSPTVSTIHFADGASAHTDLIRLTPNIDAYSLDFTGRSPQQLAHYRDADWPGRPTTRIHPVEREIAWILANSFPRVPVRRLSSLLQAAGHERVAGLKEHEAIAATQAAIWRLTNGLELDTRRLEAPVHIDSAITTPGGSSHTRATSAGTDWTASWESGGEAVLALTLDGEPQLRAVEITVDSLGQSTTVHLERSTDGCSWSPVSSSRLRLSATTAGRVVKPLGVGATVSSTGHSGAQRGHAHYRLVARSQNHGAGTIGLRDISLAVASASRFRNDDRIVYLYEHLSRRTADPVVVDILSATTRVRRLAGSRTPGGPEEFTPLVTLTTRHTDIVSATTLDRAAPRLSDHARHTTSASVSTSH